jgi:hypothetical protein
MRRPQVWKHQVCDHCGGRFGMVTHRCWGHKFCKRTCKNAYLGENHHMLSGWVIPFFAFAGGAWLAAAVAVVVLALPFVLSTAAPAEEQSTAGASLDFDKKGSTQMSTFYAGVWQPLNLSSPNPPRTA